MKDKMQLYFAEMNSRHFQHCHGFYISNEAGKIIFREFTPVNILFYFYLVTFFILKTLVVYNMGNAVSFKNNDF